MCGIAGIVGKPKDVDFAILKQMAKGLAHRGPDDEGIRRFDLPDGSVLGLVHRRLSIIDLSASGHQPMANEDSKAWITYNGELYNYKELRNDLKQKGHIFKSHSDAEVIVHSYEEWGVECLQKFRGMFAFCIWDNQKQRLFLAVDRMGIKPLYYCQPSHGIFIFSSEMRVILKTGLIPQRLNPRAINSFLAFGAVQAPETMIEGIDAFLPATRLTYGLEDGKKEFIQYWRPFQSQESDIRNENKAIALTRECLRDSVKGHLVADVGVGIFLSGGTDSSAVTALASELNSKIETFSVVFSEAGFSEREYSRLIARQYQSNHKEIVLSQEDVLGTLPDALSSMDQPSIDGINVYTISRAVREKGIKVVLSGQGGDEVFGGYSTFRRIPLLEKLTPLARFFSFNKANNSAGRAFNATDLHNVRSKISQILHSGQDTLSIYLILRQLFSREARKFLISDEFATAVDKGVCAEVVDSISDEIKGLDAFSSVSLLEMRFYLANMLLRDGDCMSMAHGLEVRVPFLDHRLLATVSRIHPKIKSSAPPKHLLLKAMGEALPESIWRRPKMGFVFPWEIWLRDRLRSRIESLLSDFSGQKAAVLNIGNCLKLWDMFISNKKGITWSRAWSIYVLLNWIRDNIDS